LNRSLFIIGSNGIPARYGGFETYAENISRELAANLDVTVVCSSFLYDCDERDTKWGAINRLFLAVKANGPQSLIYDFISLWIALSRADNILILGVGAGLFLPLFKRIKNKQVLIHIDGVEWKRGKWNLFSKFILRIAFQISIRAGSYIIIDNEALMDYIPVRYHRKLIHSSYGGNHLPVASKNVSPANHEYALVIARAEEENNLHLILSGFTRYSGLHLIAISNWSQSNYGRKLIRKFSHHANISLIGPIYSLPEIQQYRDHCQVYIHGHSAGGTNPSLIEAMYSGKPIIAWDNKFNRITTCNLAYYFNTIDGLIQQLDLIQTEKSLTTATELMNYAKTNYTWASAADQLRPRFIID